jgi:response regulator NasT
MRKKRKSMPKKRSSEEQTLIDQAKAILMNRNNMTEEEAHRYLQKTSMDNGTSFADTAQMILSMMDH